MELQQESGVHLNNGSAYGKKQTPLKIAGADRMFAKAFLQRHLNTPVSYPLLYDLMENLISLAGFFVGILLSPFILLVNQWANPGKLLYTQERVGVRGEKFQILKFRTMRSLSLCEGLPSSQKDVHRTSAFGKFLRKSHLDELPQFYNILIGEMRLIGPRPERPFVVKEFSRCIPGYNLRHQMKPGLTGWAQVKVKYDDSPLNELEKLQYDLYYLKNKNFWLDMRILLKTFMAIILLRGE